MVENADLLRQSEKLNNNSRFAVVTSTFYREWTVSQSGNPVSADQIRGDLAIETLRLAKDKGYQLVVVDGGSSREFVASLEKLGITVSKEKERGMSPSRQQGFKEATVLSGVDTICWTEPEKISMVENLQEAARPILENQADIVVPARTTQSLESYPDQQAVSEQRLNYYFNKVLRLTGLLSKESPDFDVAFGPRIFKNEPTIVELFTRQYRLRENSQLSERVKPNNYSNATFFPLILALERKLRVVSVPVPYVHPKVQTEFEKGSKEFERKRISQKQDIVRGAIELARYLIDNPQKPSELLE